MEVLDNAKNQVRNNRVAYSAINSQRGILNQQKQQLKLLKRNRKMQKRSRKLQQKTKKLQSPESGNKLSIGHVLGLVRRKK